MPAQTWRSFATGTLLPVIVITAALGLQESVSAAPTHPYESPSPAGGDSFNQATLYPLSGPHDNPQPVSVRNQGELNAALSRTNISRIDIVESPLGAPLTIDDARIQILVSNKASVIVRSLHTDLYAENAATVEILDGNGIGHFDYSTRGVLRGNSKAIAGGNAQITLYDTANATAYKGATVEAHDNSTAYSTAGATIRAHGASIIEARYSTVEVHDQASVSAVASTVGAFDRATVQENYEGTTYAYNYAQVRASGSHSRVYAQRTVKVDLRDGATVTWLP